MPIGDGHAAAMARLGLAELRQAVSLGPGSVEAPTPYGIYGNVTPGEVSASRENEEPSPQGSVTLESLRQAGADRAEVERGREMEMER